MNPVLQTKTTTAILLSSIILFHVAHNVDISLRDKAPQSKDAAVYLAASYRMHDHLEAGNIHEALGVHDRYGSLFFYLTQPFYFIFGRSVFSALLLNDLLFAILIFFTYLSGKELFSGKAGLIAAFLISFYPQVFMMSRVYMFDLGLTAMIALDLYLLLKTRGMTDMKYSILTGVSFGLSAHFKPAFIIFTIGPFLVVALQSTLAGEGKHLWKMKAVNSFLIVLFSIGIYSPWFIWNSSDVLQDTWRCINFGPPGDGIRSLSTDEFLFWTLMIFTGQSHILFCLLFIAASIHFCTSDRHTLFKKLFLSSHFALPYVFFAFVVFYNKDLRFILPMSIGVNLVSSAFLAGLLQRWLRMILPGLFLTIAFVQFLALRYGDLSLPLGENKLSFSKLSLYHYCYLENNNDILSRGMDGILQPSSNSAGLTEVRDIILTEVSEEKRKGLIKNRLIVGSSFDAFSPLNYMLMGEGSNLSFRIAPNQWSPRGGSDVPDYLIFLRCSHGLYDKYWPDGPKYLENNADRYSLLRSIEVQGIFLEGCDRLNDMSSPLPPVFIEIYKIKPQAAKGS